MPDRSISAASASLGYPPETIDKMVAMFEEAQAKRPSKARERGLAFWQSRRPWESWIVEAPCVGPCGTTTRHALVRGPDVPDRAEEENAEVPVRVPDDDVEDEDPLEEVAARHGFRVVEVDILRDPVVLIRDQHLVLARAGLSAEARTIAAARLESSLDA